MDTETQIRKLLQSVSDVLFPAELGKKIVSLNSRGITGDTPLHVLTYRNDLEGIKLLIETGADANATGEMGETSLHIAVKTENVEITTYLISKGADTKIKSEFGKTPIDIAAEKGKFLRQLFE